MLFVGRFAAFVVSCLMLSVVFASLCIVSFDASGADEPAEMENPVVIVKGTGAPRESAVTRTYTAPDYGMFIGWVENSGLRSLTIDVYDTSSGASVQVMHTKIRFAAYDASPSGRVDLPGLIIGKGRTYEFTMTPNGPRGSEALFFHGVPGIPPVASFTASIDFDYLILVDASSSYDPDGQITDYNWNWGDGTPDGSGVQSSHHYFVLGTYVITLTVTDNDYLTSSMSMFISGPPPPPPPPVFTYAVEGLQIFVDASATTDPDGVIVQYLWSWGDGSPDGYGMMTSHTYEGPGTYTVTFTAIDNDGLARSTSHSVTISG
jgi:PKD repeat protein